MIIMLRKDYEAGFGYSFLNEKLRTYARQKFPERPEYDEFSGRIVDFQQPLVNQPGERFEYGVSSVLSPNRSINVNVIGIVYLY